MMKTHAEATTWFGLGLFGPSKADEAAAARDEGVACLEDEISSLNQKVADAEKAMETMRDARTVSGIKSRAAQVARAVDDLYAVGGLSVDQRRANVAALVERVMRDQSDGSSDSA